MAAAVETALERLRAYAPPLRVRIAIARAGSRGNSRSDLMELQAASRLFSRAFPLLGVNHE